MGQTYSGICFLFFSFFGMNGRGVLGTANTKQRDTRSDFKMTCEVPASWAWGNKEAGLYFMIYTISYFIREGRDRVIPIFFSCPLSFSEALLGYGLVWREGGREQGIRKEED